VVAELQQDGLPAQNVTEWAQKQIHEAWSRKTAAAGMQA
jgi:hypothetical protein